MNPCEHVFVDLAVPGFFLSFTGFVMRSTRSYAKKSSVVQRSKNKAVTNRNKVEEEGSLSVVNQAISNSSWHEDDFVLRVSDVSDGHPDESASPKTANRQRVWFSDATVLEKVPARTRATRTSLPASVLINKTGKPTKAKVQCRNVKVVLEKLSEVSLRRWIKPQKKLSAEGKVHLDDDFSKRTKRYCMKCAQIIPNAGFKDDEPCRRCNTFLLFHCVKCGEKSMTCLIINRHLETKCISRGNVTKTSEMHPRMRR